MTQFSIDVQCSDKNAEAMQRLIARFYSILHETFAADKQFEWDALRKMETDNAREDSATA